MLQPYPLGLPQHLPADVFQVTVEKVKRSGELMPCRNEWGSSLGCSAWSPRGSQAALDPTAPSSYTFITDPLIADPQSASWMAPGRNYSHTNSVSGLALGGNTDCIRNFSLLFLRPIGAGRGAGGGNKVHRLSKKTHPRPII